MEEAPTPESSLGDVGERRYRFISPVPSVSSLATLSRTGSAATLSRGVSPTPVPEEAALAAPEWRSAARRTENSGAVASVRYCFLCDYVVF